MCRGIEGLQKPVADVKIVRRRRFSKDDKAVLGVDIEILLERLLDQIGELLLAPYLGTRSLVKQDERQHIADLSDVLVYNDIILIWLISRQGFEHVLFGRNPDPLEGHFFDRVSGRFDCDDWHLGPSFGCYP